MNTRLLLCGIATAALTSPAHALDAQAFIERVIQVYQSAYDIEFGAATVDGDTIIANGVRIGLVGPDTAPFVFDAPIIFSGVTEHADGSYLARSVTMPRIDSSFTGENDIVWHIALADMQIDDFFVPRSGDEDFLIISLQHIGAMRTGAFSLSANGEQIITYDSLEMQNTYMPQQGVADLTAIDSAFSLDGLTIDLTSVYKTDPQTALVIEALDLITIEGRIAQDAHWTPGDGTVEIKQFLFDFDKVGQLDLAAKVTGLTSEVINKLHAMQAAMNANGNAPDAEIAQAQMVSSMALLQGMSIVSASIRYDDASLTGKLLDWYAASNDSDRATLVTGLKAQLPMLVGQAGIPALTDLVVPAASTFLDNPQNLEVKIVPPSPTSFLVLVAAAANPAGLITALGLSIEANQ